MATSLPLPVVTEAPPTAEGWYILHDQWRLDWACLRHLEARDRELLANAASLWLTDHAKCDGDTACYALTGQKGDLLFLHYRRTLADLLAVQTAFRRSHLHEYLRPAGGFVSVVEVSLNEATAIAQGKLASQGIKPGDEQYQALFDAEQAKHRSVLEGRLWRPIPPHPHLCWYPMSKRRGEQKNWYALTSDERRQLMRGHGRVGHRFHQQVVQVIGGSIGFDDWEWSVDLHAEDPMVFKKLVTEMRFDPVSAWYADFGEFVLGQRLNADGLHALISGSG